MSQKAGAGAGEVLPVRQPGCLSIAAGGLRSLGDYRRFMNAAIVDVLEGSLPVPTARTLNGYVTNSIAVIREARQQCHAAGVSLLPDAILSEPTVAPALPAPPLPAAEGSTRARKKAA